MIYVFLYLFVHFWWQFCVQEDDHEGTGIVAHFLAHAGQPLSCMSFDPRCDLCNISKILYFHVL